jgi:PTH1 family peptidyl-tRNA hydrolase
LGKQVQLLVGLGNPGSRYDDTRHNLGFAVVDRIAAETSSSWQRFSRRSHVAEARFAGRSVLLVKPQSYMNRSGGAVAELVHERQVPPSDVLVFIDDIALPLGLLRIRPRGGDGGHRGLASILQVLGVEEVPRIRLGIRPEVEPEDLSEFVLEPFQPEEKKTVVEVVNRAVAASHTILVEGMDKAMSVFNAAPCSS